jgi:two-component sensor histidine kinase
MNDLMGASRCASVRAVHGQPAGPAQAPELEREQDEPLADEEGRLAAESSDVLLHELNHRLKNSLQSLLSYLSLRARQARTSQVKDALHDVRKQIIAIAVLHDEISFSATLETGSVLRKIATHLGALAASGGRIELSVRGPGAELDPRLASPFAMIAAELVWNACKHAFPKRRRGAVVVAAACDGGELILRVSDNGVGMAMPAQGGGTGLTMVRKIAGQNRGRVVIEAEPGAGTCVTVTFALPTRRGTAKGAARRSVRQDSADLQPNWSDDRKSTV